MSTKIFVKHVLSAESKDLTTCQSRFLFVRGLAPLARLLALDAKGGLWARCEPGNADLFAATLAFAVFAGLDASQGRAN